MARVAVGQLASQGRQLRAAGRYLLKFSRESQQKVHTVPTYIHPSIPPPGKPARGLQHLRPSDGPAPGSCGDGQSAPRKSREIQAAPPCECTRKGPGFALSLPSSQIALGRSLALAPLRCDGEFPRLAPPPNISQPDQQNDRHGPHVPTLTHNSLRPTARY